VTHPFARPAARAFAVLAAALAFTLGSVAPAGAASPWIPALCAAAQFTAIETSGDGQTTLHGDVTGCEPVQDRAAFTLVAFHPRNYFAHAYSRSLVTYQPGGPTPFSGVFRSVPVARQAGVCAMRTLTDRIACVRVTFPADGPATMEPISATDPLVRTIVFYTDAQLPTPPPGGFCGSCLDLPTS